MVKHYLLSLFAFLILFTFSGCSKDDNAPASISKSKLIGEWIQTGAYIDGKNAFTVEEQLLVESSGKLIIDTKYLLPIPKWGAGTMDFAFIFRDSDKSQIFAPFPTYWDLTEGDTLRLVNKHPFKVLLADGTNLKLETKNGDFGIRHMQFDFVKK